MTLKIFQNLVNQIKDITNREFGIMDEHGLIIACSDSKRVGQNNPLVQVVLQSSDDSTAFDGYAFQKIYIKNKLDLITFIESDGTEDGKYLSIISASVQNMKSYFDERFDKANFIKSIIMGNILPGDVALRAKELHLPSNVTRVVFLVKTENPREVYAYDIVQSLFPNKVKDFVVALDEENTVLVKEMKTARDEKEIERTAKVIIDTLSSELMIKACIGIGTEADDIKDIGRSFKEAQMALLVGNIFENDKAIINYNKLGIGRLIYQLPKTLCKLFLNEVFRDGGTVEFDTETTLTIQKFFENDLNISETSRELYVHRNTLVYRLDKIQKMTGLDLRRFDDAIILKVAMLVKKYLDKSDTII